jgi:hypothetical protein
MPWNTSVSVNSTISKSSSSLLFAALRCAPLHKTSCATAVTLAARHRSLPTLSSLRLLFHCDPAESQLEFGKPGYRVQQLRSHARVRQRTSWRRGAVPWGEAEAVDKRIRAEPSLNRGYRPAAYPSKTILQSMSGVPSSVAIICPDWPSHKSNR